MRRPAVRATVAAVIGTALVVALAGCTGSGSSAPDRARQAPPPAPPAACLLDTAALATTTGVSWAPDQSTATDTRCVYDAVGTPPATGTTPAFLAVQLALAPSGDPDVELDTAAQVCEQGSRAPLTADGSGFVCRIAGGSVYAAVARGGQIVTVSASAVPAGTTAARLVVALSGQLTTLGR